jgi:hypothetical protein
MRLRKIYSGVRWTAYGCGLAGVLLITLGNQGGGDWSLRVGYLLLVGMFILFSISYVLFALLRR